MNNDILPPRRPTQPPVQKSPEPETPKPQSASFVEPPVAPQEDGLVEAPTQPPPEDTPPRSSKKRPWVKRVVIGIIALVAALLLAALGGFFWYQQALRPVSSDATAELIVLEVQPGTAPTVIASQLFDKNIIRSELAFNLYTRLSQTQHQLKAGTYRLSPAESTPKIVEHLVSGQVDTITLTFYPGATLTDSTNKEEKKKVDVTSVLKRAGYTSEEITAALDKEYNHPLFATKPDTASLEGYVYGETYQFPSSATVEEILVRTFDEFYAKIEENDLIDKFKDQGLSLYEGITLASIIQREVSGAKDQKQVAQIFYKRLAEDMQLGADATFVYGAAKKGVAPSVGLDSPYNTRKHVGLPPGPISAPGITALQAVASPADGDFLYFVSGDDGTNHFSRALEEHEANTRKYCQVNCSLF